MGLSATVPTRARVRRAAASHRRARRLTVPWLVRRYHDLGRQIYARDATPSERADLRAQLDRVLEQLDGRESW
jgi:hypothetical protein